MLSIDLWFVSCVILNSLYRKSNVSLVNSKLIVDSIWKSQSTLVLSSSDSKSFSWHLMWQYQICDVHYILWKSALSAAVNCLLCFVQFVSHCGVMPLVGLLSSSSQQVRCNATSTVAVLAADGPTVDALCEAGWARVVMFV